MRRRREAAPSAAEGDELCPMCGQPVTVGPDGRCELGHRVRMPAADGWPNEDPDAAEATTMPITAVGLDEPLPEGEVRDALAAPLDLDLDLDADAATTVETPPSEPDEGEPDEPAVEDRDEDAEETPRPPTDLGGELDW